MNGNGNNTKPKLELQVNVATKIKILQDEPATGTSSYGPWWLYNVEIDGQEHSFFAPEPVVKFIEDNQLKKGDEISILKTLVKNGKKNVPDFKIEIVAEHKESVVEKMSPPTNGNGKHDDIKKIMHDSYTMALELQNEFPTLDLNRVALSIFISQTKNGNGYQF